MPPIKKESPQKFSSKMSKKPRFTLSVIAFHPEMPLEAYFFRRSDERDGYTLSYRKAVDGDIQIQMLEDNGFIQYFNRRVNAENNTTMMGSDDWACHVLMRWVPGQNPSTPHTRRDGLRLLRGFFMSSEYSKYPPHDIVTVDLTDPENPVSMDQFILDENIMTLIPMLFPPETANTSFAREYPDVARVFFSGDSFPSDAIAMYGYGNGDIGQGRRVQDIGAFAPGFNPGEQDPNNNNADSEDEEAAEEGSDGNPPVRRKKPRRGS